MLYDPCTHPTLVNRLRTLVTSCIRKHIITPFNRMPFDRPLALLTWGCKMLMNEVNDREVVQFIQVKVCLKLEFDNHYYCSQENPLILIGAWNEST